MHFPVECSRLKQHKAGVHKVTVRRFNYKKNSETYVNKITSDYEKVTQIIFDSSVYAVNGDLNIDAEMKICIEKISRNMCYALHKRCLELLYLLR